MTLNYVHTKLWKFRSQFIRKRHNKLSPLEHYAYLMQAKIDFAKCFGGIKLVHLGDSNGYELSYEDTAQFDPITINISVPGTRFDDWVRFFLSTPGSKIYRQLIESGAKFCVNLGNGFVNSCTTSTDGINWTLRSLPQNSVNMQRIIWTGSLFIAVGASNRCITSLDGINWTQRDITLPDPPSVWTSVASDPTSGVFVAVRNQNATTSLSGVFS